MPTPAINTETGGGVKEVVKDLVIEQLKEHKDDIIKAVIGFFLGLFNKKKPKPTVPIVVPTPVDEDDDIHPAPTGRTPTKIVVKLWGVKLSGERFPDADNGGLYTPAELDSVLAGNAISWGSKFWIDATIYDQNGHEFLRDAVLAHGLSFKLKHVCESDSGAVAITQGFGAGADGHALPGWLVQSNDEITQGGAAWDTSLGFRLQYKAQPASDGHTYRCYVEGFGLKSNVLEIRVS